MVRTEQQAHGVRDHIPMNPIIPLTGHDGAGDQRAVMRIVVWHAPCRPQRARGLFPQCHDVEHANLSEQ